MRGEFVTREKNFVKTYKENAALLKRLGKNGAFATLAEEDGVVDNSAEENAAVLKRLEKTERLQHSPVERVPGEKFSQHV